ncbi:MAG: LacI family transcriptional regulator [Chloroflexi bacterium]|nr:LacI family transcriptional regulator [Chloroflexota bacterium]MCC6891503.1 LacI family DNA-binding transcriptional regulator [Anaerolineae bacterium]
MAQSRRLTLRDVAKQAGVSYQTVSRVINNHPYVAEDTRQRVLGLIDELDYRPNKAARSLAGHQTNTIALVASDIYDYGLTQVVISIERAAKAAGYDLVMSIAGNPSSASMKAAIESILHWHLDGMIVLKPIRGFSHAEILAMVGGLPLVQVNSQYDDQLAPSLMINQEHGTRLLLDHLLQLGHRDIAVIHGPSNHYDAVARQAACGAILREFRMRAVAEGAGDWSAASGYAAMQGILGQGSAFTAVFAANDQMALGAMRALREHGLSIPGDVSVVGFDDLPEAAYYEPPLTTIQQDFARLGENSIAYLVECIEQPDTVAERRLIPPSFVHRRSTATPRR